MSIAVLPYEKRLKGDRLWAREEGDMYFNRNNEVFKTLRRFVDRLDELQVPYVLVGGLALFEHGYERFTTDVDLLVTPESLKTIHEKLEGLGYVPPFQGSKQLKDTETGVKIEFLVTGGYPGDGKPKSVSFPDPLDVTVEIDGLKVIQLPKLIELKLASGTAEWRGKDLVDVQELITALTLPLSLADELNESVRDSYRELWRKAQLRPVHEEP